MNRNNQDIEKNEDISLEDFLNEYVEATENATQEAKTILEEAANSTALNEFLNEGDDQMEESQKEEIDEEMKVDEAEEDVDDDDMEEVDDSEEGEDIEIDDMEDDSEDMSDEDTEDMYSDDEPEMDMEDDMPDPLSEFEPNEDGDYDLTSVDDPEKIMNIIQNAPDGAEIVLVKKSTFDVEVNDESDVDMPDGIDMETEDEPFEEGDQMEESQKEEIMDESNDMYQEDDYMNEDVAKLIKIKDKKIKIYEQKMREMQTALKQLHESNKTLQEKELKYKQTLKESKNYLEKLALVNKNLAYTSKLFTEHATTKAEKEEILKEFEDAGTIRESEIKYNFYKRQLNKRSSNNNAKEAIINEARNLKKPTKVVKESVSYKKQEKDQTKQSPFKRFANYKN